MAFDATGSVTLRNQELVSRAISLIGAGDYDETCFPHAIDLARELPIEPLITHRVPLARFDQVRDLLGLNAAPYAAMKVVVESSEHATSGP
jgi:threonine dehydrogenase-like Zn-dependent dehydrogenase